MNKRFSNLFKYINTGDIASAKILILLLYTIKIKDSDILFISNLIKDMDDTTLTQISDGLAENYNSESTYSEHFENTIFRYSEFLKGTIHR